MCSVWYILHDMSNAFGRHVRESREARRVDDPAFSLRKTAGRVGVEPSYLSKVERGIEPPPSEGRILAIARELGEDPDILLALAGRVSDDLQEVIRQRPRLFAQLIREMKDLPDHAVLRLVREVRDGNW
jgi:HTH-type transcriptional regulator, competence development regulator